MPPRRTTRSTRPRWRRSTVLAVGAVVAAAVVGPSTAGASWSSYDPDLGSDPNGQGSAPDEAASNGSSWSPSGGVLIATEVDATIPNSNSSCTWTVKGHVLVRNPSISELADGEPVEGIEVKVSGRSPTGSFFGVDFNEWGTDVTNADGEFSVTKSECGDRRVKVEAKFESDDLRVLGPDSHTWYQLHDTLDEIEPATIDLGGEPFGGESGEQSTTQARTDAQTWIVYRRAIDYVSSLGYPFLNHTTVHNPASLAPDGSWSDPILHQIHIDPDHTASVWTWLHELGHAWAYPREIGEGCLTSEVLEDQNTHDFQEERCVAFNEGFADFFASKLQQQMYGEGLLATLPSWVSTTPLKRADLVGQGLISLDRVEQNELGWDQAFRVLTSSDVTRHLFGDGLGDGGEVSTYFGPSCTGRGVPASLDNLADALQVIGTANDQFDVQDSHDEPSMADLFDRADARLGGFDSIDAGRFADFVDVEEDVEPHEAYGC